jgi:hypothetical protein
MFGTQIKEYKSPLEQGYPPEIDTTDQLDLDGIKIYQSMIDCLEWAISNGHFDIHTADLTMLKFCVEHQKCHLEQLKRIYGYLKQKKYIHRCKR